MYEKLEDFNKKREKEKPKSRENNDETIKEGEASNKKEELLLFYGKLITKIYHDASNYASLEEIGVEDHFETAIKLICLIHTKRSLYLENEEGEEVSEKIKQDISSYHNNYIERFVNIGKVTKDDQIDKVLLAIYPFIKLQEEEYELMTKDLVLLLMDLMLLLAL